MLLNKVDRIVLASDHLHVSSNAAPDIDNMNNVLK